MNRAHRLVAIAGAAIGCSRPPTEIMVSVSTDLAIPADLDQVRIRVTSESGQERFAKTYDAGRIALPLTLGLVPDKDKAVAFRVIVDGLSTGTTIIQRSATTSFVSDQSLILFIDLLRVCRSVLCSAGETCGAAGKCGRDAVDPHSLPKLGATRDGGSDAAVGETQKGDGSDRSADAAEGPVTDAPGDRGADSGPDPSLVADYEFNEDMGTSTKDSSVYGNNGTITCAVVWVPGVSGSALRFDGMPTCGQVPRLSAPGSMSLNVKGTEITLEAWVKRTLARSGAWQHEIVSMTNTAGILYRLLIFDMNGGSEKLCAGALGSCVDATFPMGVWRHIAAVLEPTAWHLYLNGIEIGTASPGVLTPDSGMLSIGYDGGSYGWEGDIDQVRIWSRARTPAEVCADAGKAWSGTTCM